MIATSLDVNARIEYVIRSRKYNTPNAKENTCTLIHCIRLFSGILLPRPFAHFPDKRCDAEEQCHWVEVNASLSISLYVCLPSNIPLTCALQTNIATARTYTPLVYLHKYNKIVYKLTSFNMIKINN